MKFHLWCQYDSKKIFHFYVLLTYTFNQYTCIGDPNLRAAPGVSPCIMRTYLNLYHLNLVYIRLKALLICYHMTAWSAPAWYAWPTYTYHPTCTCYLNKQVSQKWNKWTHLSKLTPLLLSLKWLVLRGIFHISGDDIRKAIAETPLNEVYSSALGTL